MKEKVYINIKGLQLAAQNVPRDYEEDEDDEIIESLKELNETIAEYVPTDSFDADLFGQIVESITVIGRNTLRFRLAGGLTLTEKFEERSA